MIYTSSTKLQKKEKGFNYIFLAGSIDLHQEGNWRKEVTDKIGSRVHFFDPTCLDHDKLNNAQMEAHIKWELDALEMADQIILNFLPDAESPISLVELGLYVTSNKLIVVCPKYFYKSRYVRVLCKKYNTPLLSNLNQAVNALK